MNSVSWGPTEGPAETFHLHFFIGGVGIPTVCNSQLKKHLRIPRIALAIVFCWESCKGCWMSLPNVRQPWTLETKLPKAGGLMKLAVDESDASR